LAAGKIAKAALGAAVEGRAVCSNSSTSALAVRTAGGGEDAATGGGGGIDERIGRGAGISTVEYGTKGSALAAQADSSGGEIVVLTGEAEGSSASKVGAGGSLGSDSLADKALGIADRSLAEGAGGSTSEVARSSAGAANNVSAGGSLIDALVDGAGAGLAQSSNNENRK